MSVSKPAAAQPVSAPAPCLHAPGSVPVQPGNAGHLGHPSQPAGTANGTIFRQPLRPLQPSPRWQRKPVAPGVHPRRAAGDPGTEVETLLSLFAEFPCEVLSNPAWQLASVVDSTLVDALLDEDFVQACPNAVGDEAFCGLLRDRVRRGLGSLWRTIDVVVALADTPRDILEQVNAEVRKSRIDRQDFRVRTLAFRLASPDSTVALWRSGLQLEREAMAADRTHRVTNQRRLQRFDSAWMHDLRVVAGCVASYHLIDRVLAATCPQSRLAWVEKLAHDPNWVVRGAALEALAARKGAA